MAGRSPPRRSSHAMVSHNGRILIFGGFEGGAFLGDMHCGVVDG
eukprot:CAMPEP_0183367210 /NCGR_PEP_ID=MMETSP0164_2-20130417/91683_1 /TAXON_ID=221442 /ORGANISM="Coccolithus pelagicus ssp braarudi, Strain PLY182g" /LENGTH=43 /DNA_ID= /DNA_START= /DNA_END= /DNA_ORIENTATION=